MWGAIKHLSCLIIFLARKNGTICLWIVDLPFTQIQIALQQESQFDLALIKIVFDKYWALISGTNLTTVWEDSKIVNCCELFC